MDLLIVILLAALALVSISLLKTYRHVSERELKRRAKEGDDLAQALFKAAAYGPSLGAVLWFMVGITSGIFFWFVSLNTPAIVAVLLSAGLLWYGFVWMPARDVSKFSATLAAFVAPPLAWILSYLHPIINKIHQFITKHRPITIHTGLYTKEDLLNMIQDQAFQPDSRIEKTELEIAFHALSFGDVMVSEAMIPRRAVKMVAAHDTVGPVMMSELHDSGFSRFPVYAGSQDHVVGTLYLRDLVGAKTGGQIDKLMHDDLAFIHDEQTLADALQAILKTRRHQYIVVNSFEEFVGIITMEDILERIVGHPIIDEFDQYDDVRAVAARAANKEHKEHIADKSEEKPEKPTSEPPEVVE